LISRRLGIQRGGPVHRGTWTLESQLIGKPNEWAGRKLQSSRPKAASARGPGRLGRQRRRMLTNEEAPARSRRPSSDPCYARASFSHKWEKERSRSIQRPSSHSWENAVP
jgi:hypothetical protein